MTLSRKSLFVTAVVAGLPWCLSFSPLNWWAIGLFQLVGLSFVVGRMSPGRSFVVGLGFGLGAFGAGISWLYISLHVYGGLPSWMSVLSVFGLALFLALFPAFACFSYRKLIIFGRLEFSWARLVQPALWASCWTIFEWVRSWLFSGFAWLSLGDSLVDSPLNDLLPWAGNHGALWLVLFVFGITLQSVRVQDRRVALVTAFCSFAVVALLLAAKPQTEIVGTATIAGVQPNVDQSVKFEPDQIVNNMRALFELGEIGLSQLPDSGVLIFPETVNPLVWTDTPPSWLKKFRSMAENRAGSVITGGALKNGAEYYNAIVQFKGDEPDEQLVLPTIRHEKRHLVPFGERIPPGFHWFVRMLNMPMGEFTPGKGELTLFDFNGLQVAGTICYEDTFSGEFASLMQLAAAEPHVFLNLSNLAWFRGSWALDQHAQMGRARSSEHRKPGIRVTNTGISGLVDHEGQFVKKVPRLEESVWIASVEGRTGPTPFAKWGSNLWFFLWGGTLMLVWLCRQRFRAYNTPLTRKS